MSVNPFALGIALFWGICAANVAFFEGGLFLWLGAAAFTLMAVGGD